MQKAVYFNTGEKTTGTQSPKSAEFGTTETGRQLYRQWRDSYVEHQPAKARQLLDELGVIDADGDGVRELPNGKKLELRLDYSADQSQEHTSKDAQLVADLEAVGLKMIQNPIPPQTYDDQWKTGKLMSHTNWEITNTGMSLVEPQWLLPMEYTRWAPLQGQWYQQLGTRTNTTELDLDPWERRPPRMEPEKAGPIARLWDLYDRSKIEPDEMKRIELVHEIEKIHQNEGPFFMGCVANYPQVVVIKNSLRNVPRKENLALGGLVNPWGHPTPAVYDPETYFWEDPDNHG